MGGHMMYSFLSGVFVMGLAACGTFFLKYWLVTRDRLFVCFSIAFWLLALERLLLVALNLKIGSAFTEQMALFYAIRCAAFVLILYAIIDKSRRQVK